MQVFFSEEPIFFESAPEPRTFKHYHGRWIGLIRKQLLDPLIKLNDAESRLVYRLSVNDLGGVFVKCIVYLCRSGRQADGGKHNAPPVFAFALADDDPKSFVFPCGQGEIIIFPCVEPCGSHGHAYRVGASVLSQSLGRLFAQSGNVVSCRLFGFGGGAGGY